MSVIPRARRRSAISILAFSWSTIAALQCNAGRELNANEIASPPAPAVPSDLPLIAQAADSAVEPPVLTDAKVEEEPSVSDSLTINLINRLVARGVLPKEDADQLVKQAEADTAKARARTAAAQDAAVQSAVQAAVNQTLAAVQAQQQAELPPLTDDTIRVPYIPESVKAQMREQIKQEVMAKAREENWAAPRTLPEWTTRIRLFGDVRVRGEGVFFGDQNDATGFFPDFNAINTGPPFDVSGFEFAPQLNVDQDRYRLRLRVRLGAEADLGNGFYAGLRIATGDSNSPVSTNQSLGLANQRQGGNFSKYALWLDRGFLAYETASNPNKFFRVALGRFDNPFFATEMIWDDDVGFDGIALQARYEVTPGLTPFLTAGAFPVFNTDFNFATNQPAKFKSSDKWLYAAQLGTNWKPHKDYEFKLAAAYYHFDNVEGQLSDPFIPLSANDQGNTDNTRPSFAQKGNTYMPLRRIIASPLNNFGTTNQFQYYGLATPFHELALTARLDINRWEPFQISLWGEWVKNVAFDRNDIDRVAVNNRGSSTSANGLNSFDGGDSAWMVHLRVGSPALEKTWDWQVGVNYRYVESDAVVDGFTDSDFGLGGTNLKGYTLWGAVALSPKFNVGLRYMTADEVAGPPLAVDILQLNVSGSF